MSPIKIRRALATFAAFGALAAVVPAQAATISYSNGNSAMSITDTTCTTSIVMSGSGLICQSGGGGTTLTAPTGCNPAIATNPTTLTSTGGTATVSVTGCVASSSLTYTWTKNGAFFSSAQNPPADTLAPNLNTSTPQTTTYRVNVCNTDGTTSACTGAIPTAGLTATVPVAAGSGAISCSGFTSTIVLDFKWGPKAQTRQITSTPFGNQEIVIASFTTPANLANNGAGGWMGAVEYAGLVTDRTGVLSTKACDFSPAADSTHGYWMNGAEAIHPKVYFSSSPFTGVVLKPSTTYYFNIKNERFGKPTCGDSDCPIAVTLQTN